MHRPLLLAVLLTFVNHAHALTVNLDWTQFDFCGDGVGIMQAWASGGVEPYQYTWYQWVGSEYVLLCSDCGPTQNMLNSGDYKVVVMDNVGAMAEAVNYLPSNDLAVQPWDIQMFPYVAGEQPYLKLYVGNTMPPNGSAVVSVSGSQLMAEPTEPGNGIGIWWFRLLDAPGTIGYIDITYTYPGGQCAVGTTYTVPPPTVLPTLAVIDVQGSCANAPTGSITVALYDGTLHNDQPLAVMLGTQSFWYPGTVWTGQNTTATTTTITVNNLPAGSNTFWLTGNNTTNSTPASMGFAYGCHLSVPFTITNLGPTCGRVQGRVFVDNNVNCTWQSGEPGLSGNILEIQPGPVYATVGSDGTYDVVLSPGAYTIEEQVAAVDEHCVNAPIPFTITGSTAPVAVNHACVSVVPLDVAAVLSSGAARPGFQYQVSVSVRNNTPSLSGGVTLALAFDPLLGFLNASTAPSTVGGNTLTWNLPQLTAFQQRNILVNFQVPPDVALLGQPLITSATVSTVNTDGNPGNNNTTMVRTITGAYDPNDKLAWTSTGNTGVWRLDTDEWIDYTIRFQNTGTDTAFHVIITDTLPSTLDPSSLEVGSASHPFSWEVRDAGTLKFRFLNIQLPDSNVNEPRSHGFVSFRIRPHEGLAVGQQITNIANIYFDFNPPVITDPSVLDVVSPLRVDARAWLGGAFDDQSGLMHDSLRTLGLLPLVEPFTALGYVHSGDGGGETFSPALLNTTGPTAIVDWVVLELRDPAQPANVLHSRAALLRRDGRITDKDGTSPVAFNAPVGSYHLALRHRNHLGVMSAAPIALGSIATAWDVRTTTTPLHGINPTRTDGTRRELWPGDVDRNGVVRYTGQVNDRDPVLIAIGGVVPTAVVNGVYSPLDVNLDGRIKYVGSDNDRDIILQTIGGVVPTAVRVQQLP